jgi:hypothetical protein
MSVEVNLKYNMSSFLKRKRFVFLLFQYNFRNREPNVWRDSYWEKAVNVWGNKDFTLSVQLWGILHQTQVRTFRAVPAVTCTWSTAFEMRRLLHRERDVLWSMAMSVAKTVQRQWQLRGSEYEALLEQYWRDKTEVFGEKKLILVPLYATLLTTNSTWAVASELYADGVRFEFRPRHPPS